MKEWGGRRYNTDFEPIDDQGNVLGPKDEAASEGWTNANEPWRNTPGWHGQPLSPEQERGIQQTNPSGWAERQAWRAANPTSANGRPLAGSGLGGQNNPLTPGAGGTPAPSIFEWGGWNVGGTPQTGGGDPNGQSMSGNFGPGPMTIDPATGQATHMPPPGGGGMVRAPEGQDVMTGGGDPMPGGGYSWMPPGLEGATPGNGLPPNYGQPSQIGMVRGPGGTGGFGGGPRGPGGGGYRRGDGGVPQVQAPTLGPGYDAPTMDSAALLSQLGDAPTVAQAGPLSQFGSDVQGSIQQGLGPASVNTNDPAYRAQVEAFQRNAQRNADRTRAALAARANANGTLNSGGFESQVRRVLSDQGAQEQDFEAQLMASELASARDRQARAQQLGAGLLSQEQSQGLQERLANQNAGLQRFGLQNTRDLANQGVQQQTGLANQSSRLQTQGLNNQRDLASMSAGLQAALANQGAGMQQRGLDLSRYTTDQNNALQRYGIDTTADTARRGLDLQGRLGSNDQILRRNALMLQQQLGLGDLDLRRLGLTNQDNQFYAGLGQQLGLGEAALNQQALLALLGG